MTSQDTEITTAGPKGPANGDQSYSALLSGLGERRESPKALSFDERLAVLDAFSDALLERGNTLIGAPLPGLPFLAGFLRRSNLEKLVSRQIPNPEALRRFCSVGERKSLRLVPRGIVCHWIAGNVPLLGMFSWALSALAGNLNVIRLSTRQDDFITPILSHVAELSEGGKQMVEETVVLRFERDNLAAHEDMSNMADVRIAWGGQEAVEAIRALPCRWTCEDIVLGPRASLAVVDPALMTKGTLSRLVTDIVFFDQLACSSPQLLFVRGRPGESSFDSFFESFCAAFATQSTAIPRHPLDFAETFQIQLDRTRMLLDQGKLSRDRRTQWTVAAREQPLGSVVCANRFIQVIPASRWQDVTRHIPNNVQTIVTLLSKQEHEQFTEEASHHGVCRFPRPGEGNNFEDPWDGVALLARLCRWVIRSDPRS